tara:strand:- start:664 stop:930 length:267 start_codon:yes stop_codon:yes gene_type:complete
LQERSNTIFYNGFFSGKFAQSLQTKRSPFFQTGALGLGYNHLDRILLCAVFVVVVVPNFKRDPEFVAKKTIYRSQKELEHSLALSEFQ